MLNDTPCKDCCFAIYEDITQVGCSRNRIEKYKNAGNEIIEAYDEDKEFYVIKGRLCPYYRNRDWLNRIGDNPTSLEMMLSVETAATIHLIIFLRDKSIEELDKTIKSIDVENSSVKPIQVTVVRPRSSKLKVQELKDYLNSIQVIWRIENLIVDMDDTKTIHMIQKTLTSQYYCTCNSGFEFEDRYFEKMNNAVLEDLLQFGMIESSKDSNEGIIIPIHVHQYWYFNGDTQKSIPENIREYQCQNPKEKIVFQISNL